MTRSAGMAPSLLLATPIIGGARAFSDELRLRVRDDADRPLTLGRVESDSVQTPDAPPITSLKVTGPRPAES